MFMPNPLWGFIKLYDKKKGRFPIGLVQTVKHIIMENGHEVIVNLQLRRLEFYDDTTLRSYQAIACKMLEVNRGGIVQIPTGGGKTKMCISLLKCNEGIKKLVLVPTIDLRMQWEKQVSWDTTVKTYQSIKSKSFLKQFGIVVFDECHHVAARTLFLIGMNVREDANIIGLSATPTMRDDDNLKVFAVLGRIVYKISIQELTTMGYLAGAEVIWLDGENDTDLEIFKTYSEVYKEQIVHNVKRNEKIVEIVKHEKSRILILVNLIEHGEILYQMIPVIEDVVFLNGSVKSDVRKNVKERVIIATSIFDEGVDMPDLGILIVAGGGKSQIKTLQRAGRLLRPGPGKIAKIYDFNDSAKWLRAHSRARAKTYAENLK